VAEPRIALVIGNGAYQSVSSLPNPVNDAALMAQTLESAGFEVTLIRNGDLPALQRAISAFGADLREAGSEATGLFYYAGHGVQSFGRNYLLPVDAAPGNAADLGLVALEAESVLRQMASARNRTNIVILDACRNNPFEDILELGDNGLAEMNAPTGTFLAYATAPGNVAMDGLGDNSPFTEALAVQIVTPGLPIEQAFKQVRVEVIENTNGMQTPWDTSSLTADFFFVQAEAVDPEALAELQLWDSVRVTRDPVQIMLFLRAYPGSGYSIDARELLIEVMALEVSGTTTEAAPEPEPDVTKPDPAEVADFTAAQQDGSLAVYQEFAARYPDGIFIEAARSEIAALESAAAAAAAAAAEPLQPLVPDDTPDVVAEDRAVTFGGIMTTGSEVEIGNSIELLIQGSPLFPPFEGLPEELWKDQTCTSCHEWTRDALCTQATVYTGQNAQRSLALEHPYGTAFKQTLRAWAAGGCQ